MDAVVRKELDKSIVERRSRKMEGNDPKGGRWKIEDEKQEDGR